MALKGRDVFVATAIAVLALSIISSWSPTFRYFGYAILSGSILAIALLIILIVSTPGRRPRNTQSNGFGKSYRMGLVAPAAWQAERAQLNMKQKYIQTSLYEASFVVSDALDKFLGYLMRDFVFTWYRHISQNPSFPDELDRAVRFALISLRDRILATDVVEVTVSRFVPLITDHLKNFNAADKSVRGKNLSRNVTESEELDLAVAEKYLQGHLHPAASLSYADLKLVQQQYLRKLAQRLIPDLMPDSQCASLVVQALVREIVACNVLSPMMQMLADPDMWNLAMESYGRSMLQDRKTVKQLRAALDQHASPNAKSRPPQNFPRLAPLDNERKFEKFIRAARNCAHLSDARRFRSEVSSQLKKESRINGQDQLYLRRLELGKQALDRRVASLAARSTSEVAPASPLARKRPSRLENASLNQILHDVSGLSSFMEYMERLNKMSLVQFWIVVDGLRNPLEADTVDEEASHTETLKWSESERNDIAQISQAYLPRPELKVSDSARNSVKDFLNAGTTATIAQYQRARFAILSAQSSVLEDMQKRYFQGFRHSDLFFKLLSTDESSSSDRPSITDHESLSPTKKRPGLKERPTAVDFQKARPEAVKSSSSSAELTTAKSLFLNESLTRRSLDESSRPPLFDDDSDSSPLSKSTLSLDTKFLDKHEDQGPDKHVVQAVEAALNDLIENPPDAEEDLREPLLSASEHSVGSGQDEDSPSEAFNTGQMKLSGPPQYGEKPNISSLGLVNTSSRIGVFTDDDLFPDEKRFIQDEHEDPSEENEPELDEDIREAAPGDLGLSEAISILTVEIDKLGAQDAVIDSLLRKAELTNNTVELRILRKSKASLEREMRRNELQRQQYIVQESDNSLYGRASIRIKSIMVGTSDDGHEYALYVVEVQRKAGEQMPAATWAIARRYSEFHDLQSRLRDQYASVRGLDFPRRRVVMKLQKDFLQKRKNALEQYLNKLLRLPDVCRSRELRSFLSQQTIAPPESGMETQEFRQDILSRFYNSVSDGMEDLFGNLPVLDQLSSAGQNLFSAATGQMTGPGPAMSSPLGNDEGLTNAEAEKELKAFEDRELEPFVKPICDIFLELFELNKGNNWLRGRAVVVVLHQLLGGTIERKIRENTKQLFQEEAVAGYIDLMRETLWPNGKFRQDIKPRTTAEKNASRTEANLMLGTLFPDLAGSVVGKANSQAAARRFMAAMNNGRLNTHLAFTFLDEVIDVLFPQSVT